jgi:hypothetical protein
VDSVTVRGWLIVGETGFGLPDDARMPGFFTAPPDAASYAVGTWLICHPTPEVSMALVCIEVTL